ncbi:MAG: hypothetical protein JO328_18820 [Hyphomicrobiales bacterium]|nr:hypothetical protein [Hyphomicrobiales bacterium]MBV8825468.1 hypothetical protein [Hyphomicrobiales bacterium]MBV9429482.1 hypothetical protein [Bradyrhizobiaceae bacterium]
MLLAGPSNAGLAEPGFGAIRSLNQISSCLLCLSPTFDNVIALKIMTKLGDEIFEALSNAHQNWFVTIENLFNAYFLAQEAMKNTLQAP